MARENDHPEVEQTRSALVDLLLSRVKDDKYPSATMLDLLEQLLTVEELPAYAGLLMEKVAADTYPSASVVKRLVSLAS